MPKIDVKTANKWFSDWEKWAGLPPNTLKVIAMRENSYNPQTGEYSGKSSPKGATGLMQLMPIAIADIKAQYGVTIDPNKPLASILGAAMLMQLTKRYIKRAIKRNPTVNEMLAGYNGGWTVGRDLALGKAINKESADYVAYVTGKGIPGNVVV